MGEEEKAHGGTPEAANPGDDVAESENAAGGAASKQEPPALDSVAEEIEAFVRSIEGLRTSLSLSALMVTAGSEMARTALRKFTEKNGEISENGGKERFSVPSKFGFEFNKLAKIVERTKQSRRILPRAFLVALVSQYDAFLGRLIQKLFLLKPELLSAGDKQISIAQVLEYSSFEDVRRFIVEKEIEGVLRESHIEQFKWLESKFSLPLRKELPVWQTFVELTERRNLFVHTDGTISSQYLVVCEREGVVLDETQVVGVKLDVNPQYFEQAYACVLEIGVKLAQVLWRKIRPDQLDEADSSLIGITFELVADEQYELAEELLRFATNVLKKHHSESNQRTLLINLAQAYKWQGKDDKCTAVLASKDWSATSLRFELAVAVLEDRFEDAARTMKSIGKEGEVRRDDYAHWPLFREFRKTADFKTSYQDIFGEPFAEANRTSFEVKEKESGKKAVKEFMNLDTSFYYTMNLLKEMDAASEQEATQSEAVSDAKDGAAKPN